MNKPVNLTVFKKNELATPEEVASIFVSEFDSASLSSFYTAFIKLNANPLVTIIPVVVSSYGGQVYSLLGMLDIMSSTTKPVATIGIGKAMSCGSVLLAAGTPGYRYIGQNTDVMIHEVASYPEGKTTELKASVQNTERLNTLLLEKLSGFCNKDKSFFKKAISKRTNTDWFLGAKDCKKMGLVDHIGVPQLLTFDKIKTNKEN